ncbi:uncharacterized protein LOC121699624 isoform X2 [Alosa sapidissima]|uniref:uncharacterized protein LOC121699624 isoform X2 n=1 Tax=Alosa sapidissima TaxID=34773 RepID=UPI001C08A6A8|nr:uncharacterized protein LOC121699624 isoform X2 [Alosa sapidissima]
MVTCSRTPNDTSSKTEQDTLEEDGIVITGVQSGRTLPAALSRRVEDFRAMLLSPHSWLDDRAIDHAQALLKLLYPNIGGLHATTSVALLSTVPSKTQGFVQILNVCANHWVTVSDIGCKVGAVNIFDSLNRAHTQEFEVQVTGLLCFPGKSVTMQWPVVQQQEGGTDCGLFAIANSLTICRGEDPCITTYDQRLMRDHLFACFQKGFLTPFPGYVESPPMTLGHAMELDIHCLCRRAIRSVVKPFKRARRVV